MTTLLPTILLVLLACTAAGFAAYYVIKPNERRLATVIALFAVAWIVADMVHFRRTYAFARWIGWQDVMALANLEPLAVAVLIGVGLRVSKSRTWLKGSLATIFAGLMLWQSYGQFFGSPPQTGDRWRGQVCRQTSKATCSCAAAATMLRMHGIPATETEMAQLCLTTDSGTQLLGLYRGLRMKTEGTPWKVVPFRGDIETLRQANRPAILTVGLGYWQTADAAYARDWGWTRGLFHTVVFQKFVEGGKVEIGDPGVGREEWHEQGIRDLWKGEGYWLVPR